MSPYLYLWKFWCRIHFLTWSRRSDKGLLMFEGLTCSRTRLQFTCRRKTLTMAAPTDGCRVEGCLKTLTFWKLRNIFKFSVKLSPTTLVTLLSCRMSWTLQKNLFWKTQKTQNSVSQTQRLLLPSAAGQRALSQWQWSRPNFSPHSWERPRFPQKRPEKKKNQFSLFCLMGLKSRWAGDSYLGWRNVFGNAVQHHFEADVPRSWSTGSTKLQHHGHQECGHLHLQDQSHVWSWFSNALSRMSKLKHLYTTFAVFPHPLVTKETQWACR